MATARAPSRVRQAPPPAAAARPTVEGFVMRERTLDLARQIAPPLGVAWRWAFAAAALIALGALWEARRIGSATSGEQQ
jgi:hypothetical protein